MRMLPLNLANDECRKTALELTPHSFWKH